MELVFAVVIPFLIAAACAWFRFQPRMNFRPIPVAAFLVLLAGSVLGSDFFSLEFGPIPITLDRILLAGTLALFGALVVIGREDLRVLNRVDAAILTLMVVIAISAFSNDWTFHKNRPVSRLLFFNLMPLALYWVVRCSRLEKADLKFIAFSFGLFGVYLAVTAIAEVKGYSGIVFPGYIMTSETTEFLGRGRGPLLNPVVNGIFQTVCFCCVLMWWPRVGTNKRILLLTAAMVIAIGIYATMTRSVWLGLIAACGLFIWLPANRPTRGAMLVLATIITIVSFPVLSEKVFSFKRDKDVTQAEMEKSADLRPLFAIVAWKMFQDRPITGVGFGQYAQAKHPYLQDPYSGKPLSLTKDLMQHNVFLAYLTETGLIGLAVLLIMLFQMGRVSWKVWSDRAIDLWARQFGLLSLALLAAYAISGMFHDVSIIPMQHMLLFFVFGLANNIYSKPAVFELSASPAMERGPAQRKPSPAFEPTSKASPAGC